MATPKSLTVSDLSGAVRSAVAHVKLTTSSYVVINPGVICGFYLREALAAHEAEQIATSIAKQVAAHTGVPVAPVVHQVATGEVAAKEAHATTVGLKLNHLIMGYVPRPEEFITFGF
ncbi:MAG TPA: hypothetical protein VGC07_02585 [Granulicella sp.]